MKNYDEKNIINVTLDNYKKVVKLVQLSMDDLQAKNARYSFRDIDSYNYRFSYLYIEKRKPIGVIGYFYSEGRKDVAWFSYFAVHPERQREGLGEWLLEYLEKILRDLKVKKLFVETYGSRPYKKAIKFYQKNGFVLKGNLKDYMDDKSEILYLGKKL